MITLADHSALVEIVWNPLDQVADEAPADAEWFPAIVSRIAQGG